MGDLSGAAPTGRHLTGIVTGLRAEARLLRAMPLVACAGAEPETAARALLAAGATRLMSFGLAGGLDPALTPGTLILATEIVADDTRWPTDSTWADALALPGPTRAPLLHAPKPLASRNAKAAAFAATGAGAVDMESGAVARVAAAAGVPVLALRAIADPAELSLPPLVLRVVDAQGSIRPRVALAALALHPWTMMALTRQARRAMAALRGAAEMLG